MSEHKTEKGLIDVNKAVRSSDSGRIKELEKEKIQLKEQLKQFEETKKQVDKFLKKYEAEKEKKNEAEHRANEKNVELQEKILEIADIKKAFEKQTKEMMGIKFAAHFKKSSDKH